MDGQVFNTDKIGNLRQTFSIKFKTILINSLTCSAYFSSTISGFAENSINFSDSPFISWVVKHDLRVMPSCRIYVKVTACHSSNLFLNHRCQQKVIISCYNNKKWHRIRKLYSSKHCAMLNTDLNRTRRTIGKINNCLKLLT